MPWVKIDDQFSDHPKVIDAGPLAECLFVRGLTYASRYLTDGFIPASHLRRMGDMDAIEEAGRLVAVGLWHEADGGYRIHDYLDYNPSAEKVKADREAARERMGKARSSKPAPNIQARSDEVRANFAGSSDNPVPVPVPDVSKETFGEGANAPDQPKDTEKRKRATQCPKDFTVTDQIVEWGNGYGYTRAQMLGQVPQFVDHYRSKGETRKDWVLTFYTWMRNAETYGHVKPVGGLTVHRGGNTSPFAGSGFDPLYTMSPEEKADFERRMEESKARTDALNADIEAKQRRSA